MADKVIVEFGGKATELAQEISKVQGLVGGLSNMLLSSLKGALVATFSITALKQFVAAAKESMDSLVIVQRQTGANTDQLQVWEKQIKRVGGSLEDVTRMINKLAVAREKALEDTSGKESKAFANLGVSRLQLLQNDGASLMEMLQNNANKAGHSANGLADIMDLVGEKSVKFLSIFNASFDSTRKHMEELGLIIDKNVIEKYENLGRLNTEYKMTTVIAGSKNEAAGGANSSELTSLIIKYMIGSLASAALRSYPTTSILPETPWDSHVKNTADELGARTMVEMQRVPGQKSEAQINRENAVFNKEAVDLAAQSRRISELKAKIAHDALTDEEKLTKLYREQESLLSKMMVLEKDKKRKLEFNDYMEQYLRNTIPVKDLRTKVEKENAEKTTKANKVAESNDKMVNDYMDKIRKGVFGQYQSSDSLSVGGGGFLGSSKSRFENIAQRQLDVQTLMQQDIRKLVERKTELKKDDFPFLG